MPLPALLPAITQVYNDVLYDLLDINSSPSELTLYEDAAGQLQVCVTHTGLAWQCHGCDNSVQPVGALQAAVCCSSARHHAGIAGRSS